MINYEDFIIFIILAWWTFSVFYSFKLKIKNRNHGKRKKIWLSRWW